ncbi:MAG: DUF1549 domain-containing protein [Verrucomicrobiales bacterium]
MKAVLLCLLLFSLACEIGFAQSAKPPASQRIDQLLAEAWQQHGVQPNPEASEETWLRRIYLDVVGRIPTAAEAENFSRETAPDKRPRLIDALLASDGYVHHFYNFWADLLRVNTETSPNRLSQEAYARWIRGALHKNKPYDEFVRDLLTQTGTIWDSGASGYFLRDPGMPLDNLSNTVQVFLGTRIVCAQCHNHPFDKWTQMDYYKMAAFTYGVETGNQSEFTQKARQYLRDQAKEKAKEELEATLNADRGPAALVPPSDAAQPVSDAVQPVATTAATPGDPQSEEKARKETQRRRRELQNRLRGKYDRQAQQHERRLQQGYQLIGNTIRGTQTRAGTRFPKLPHDYQYQDAKPGQEIHPVAMFGPSVSLGENESPLKAFGNWITAPDNPRFTRVIANRLWKKVIGRGLIEPVDEWTDETQPALPELMTFLEATLKELRYDLKAYVRVLLNTDLYARQASSREVPPDQPYLFPGPLLRRLSAEQVWDSFVALSIPDFERQDPRRDARFAAELLRARTLIESLNALPPDKLVALGEELHGLQQKNGGRAEELRKEVRKARADMNKARADDVSRELNRLRRNIEQQALDLIEERTGAKIDQPGEASIRLSDPMVSQTAAAEEKAESGQPPGKEERDNRQREREQQRAKREWQRVTADLYRACFISSPAPRGHFLREFGQSDREIIDNANDEATVTQALNLMNGRMFGLITNKNSVFAASVEEKKTAEEKLSAIYLSLLGRQPTAEELETLRNVIRERGESRGLEDTVHALINTREFLYVR